jgi:SAM-dependent methyltransferase
MRSELRPDEDAYGRILLDAYEGRDAYEIMERDDGLVYAGSPADYFAPFRRWPATERRAMRFVRGRVLDVGCGAGRVALHLQERGLDVVAIDESPGAVEVSRRRGVRDARVARLDDVDGPFETVLVLRNNFGLGMLDRVAALTGPRGRLVTDSVDPARVERPAGDHRFRVRWLDRASPWFRYLMLGPAELGALVGGAGWRVRAILDDGSPRYAAVLEKGP